MQATATKAPSVLFLIAVCLVAAALSATSVTAKPLFCNWECTGDNPDAYCTCPAGTDCYGSVLTCANYEGEGCGEVCFVSSWTQDVEVAEPAPECSLTAPEAFEAEAQPAVDLGETAEPIPQAETEN